LLSAARGGWGMQSGHGKADLHAKL
jgi:hypothetical protein